MTPRSSAYAAAASARAKSQAAQLAAITAAQATVAQASVAYDAAKLAFASAQADYDAAGAQAGAMHTMLAEAELRADTSKRLLASIVRAMMQQDPAAGAAAVLLSGDAGADLLSQLGTIDSLARLSASLDKIKERVNADAAAAEQLRARETNTDGPLNGVDLQTAKDALGAAKARFDQATAKLTSLQTTMSAELNATPLPVLPPLTMPIVPQDSGQLSAQGWANPAVGSLSDGFGPRPDRPLPGVGAFHYGTDIGANCGAGIYAATSGVVEEVTTLGTYGNWILINHGNGIETGYAHILSGSQLVAVGDSVIAGQVIAGVGSTGASTGCHLHYEVRINGERVDSLPFMAARGITVGG